MKVLILTEAGRRSGFGHLTRCIALCQAFEEKAVQPEFLINGDNSILSLLKNVDYRLTDWLNNKNRILKIVKKYQSVIIDSYLASKPLYEAISRNISHRLIVIDDYCRLDYPKSTLINPSIYGDRLNYGRKDRSVFLLGKSFIILRKEFWDIKKKKINKKIKNILITFGGRDYSGLIKRIIYYFKDRYNFKFEIIDALNKASALKMTKLMLKADVCISGGGQTTYELARCGLPVIGICFADNQLMNLKAWQKTGFLKFISRHNDKQILLKIEKTLNSLNYRKLLYMSNAGRRLVDGQGARRIVREVIKTVK